MRDATPTRRQSLAVIFRTEGLAVLSIVGLALNLIGSLGPLLTLAEFARYLVEHWIDMTSFVWVYLFSLIHVHIPALLGFALTLFVFHLGLTVSSLRGAGAESDNVSRDRLIAIVLYVPILAATLSKAFGRLSRDLVEGSHASSDTMVIVAFCIVLVSPIMVFSLARPSGLIRRLAAVYFVAGLILLLDFAARALDGSGVLQRLKRI
ncbi:MAG TPA: hypothetical protein VG943_13050 [Caulobacterales bacterium]|nr:hypothetical protein [Caulobacterales bacterium]